VLRVAATILTALLAAAPAAHARTLLLGRSYDGRRIVAIHAGDPRGPRVIVVGSMHGNEPAGLAVARALARVHRGADLWIVPNLNPDGAARGTRQNARGVDLNANWSSQWRRGGRPFDVYYGGRRPFSERETRIARRLILRLHPRLTVWFHQHMDVVWAFGPSTAAGRIYAHASGIPLYHHHWLPGTATNWQNHRLPDTASITVELPAGRLSARQVRRQVGAVLAVVASPSRLASAPASPRLRTSSLRSTADTWWSTVLSDTTSRLAICELRNP
jgi:protein MpaA